jgi:ubiquinone/menaquinone biosynthesis C-methylase UbiE
LPGRAVGIDIAETQVTAARTLATERGLANVRFDLRSVYEMPFPDASFDLAFAHCVLEHLGDPLRAPREMRRVLRPGGLVAVQDTDRARLVIEPDLPRVRTALDLTDRMMVHTGCRPTYGPRQRAFLLEAGFERTEGFAFTECYRAPEETQYWGNALAAHLASPAIAELMTAQGWLDREELALTIEAQRAWGQRPDAYFAVLFCAALGWVPIG